MLRKMSKYRPASVSFVPRSAKVKPTHNNRQYMNTLASSSSSSVNTWTTSIYSSDLQILTLRRQVMPNDRKKQKSPIVVKGRVDRSTSISSSIVGTSALIGETTICPMNSIIALGLLSIPSLLGANIYLFISTISAIKTCSTTADLINWPLTGSIIGLLSLAALTSCCLLCWHYCCSLCGKYPYEGNIELYHIERCIDPNCYWIDNENDNCTNLKMCLEENINLRKQISGVSISRVKRGSIILDAGNPGIKPPYRQADEDENRISLFKLENNEICTRQKTAEMKNGIQVTRVRSKPLLITHLSSTNDRCPSTIGNSIYLNNYDEIKPIPGVSISRVKRDSITLDEGNPGIKPPDRQTDEDENRISLFKLENNEICTRQKTAEMKNGIQVTRVRSKPLLITHPSSTNDRCPSIIGNSIYLNNYDEIKPVSNALNIDQMNNSSSSQQPIPLNETELTQDSPKPNSADNNSKILSVLTRVERIPKKIKPNTIYLESINEIPKDKNKSRPRVKHVRRQNLL